MIECFVTAEDVQRGIQHVVIKLRAAGIPVRMSYDNIRLCQEWDVRDKTMISEGDRVIGYGRLEAVDDVLTMGRMFRYWSPVPQSDPNTIDVEAREIRDVPLLKG